MSKLSVITVRLPPELHLAAKIVADKCGKSLNQWLVDLIDEFAGDETIGDDDHAGADESQAAGEQAPAAGETGV